MLANHLKLFLALTLTVFTFALYANESSDQELVPVEQLEQDLEQDFLESDNKDWDRDWENDQRPGGYDPRPGRDPRWPDRQRGFVCWAQDHTGRSFRGFGQFPRMASRMAMEECRRGTFQPYSCRPLGCRQVGQRH